MNEIKAVNDFLNTLIIGKPDSFENMTVYPVTTDIARPISIISYATIKDEEAVQIVELTKPDVPMLKVINNTDMAVFIVDGTILIGNLQTRTIRHDMLVNARTEVEVDVYCVEHGRWGDAKKNNRATYCSYPNLRKKRESHQGEIWSDLKKKSERLGVKHLSGSVEGLFENEAIHKTIDDYVNHFKFTDKAVGFMVTTKIGNIMGLDIFGDRKLFFENKDVLLRGYSLDVWDSEDKAEPKLKPEDLLEMIKVSEKVVAEAKGSGKLVKITNKELISASLVYGDCCLHLSAFLN